MNSSKLPRLHPNFSYRIDRVGNELEPVLVIDNFLDHADTLIDVAERFSQFNQVGNVSGYPGVQAWAPEVYIESLHHHLQDIMVNTFELNSEKILNIKTNFSMVTTPPSDLKPIQSIPHYDSTKRSELAAVHYLCAADQGGTSLYRHKATGYESIDAMRVEEYEKIAHKEMESSQCKGKYMNGSNDFFEQIASYEAEFNRIIMYRCTSLHSGNIAPHFTFDANPRTGRLTLNTFVFTRE
jgi:Family of unknown function (DUF6445)